MTRPLPFDLGRLRRMRPSILFAAALLLAIGVAFVYSANSIREEASLRNLYRQHAMVGGLGLLAAATLAYLDFRVVLRLAWPAYVASVALLVAVPLAGDSRMGAQRWVWGVQPSEFAKLAMVLVLAWLLARPFRRGWTVFLLAVLLVAVPAALVLRQPDLGTALVFASIGLAMLFVSGTAPRALLIAVLAGALAVAAMLGAVVALEQPGLKPGLRRPAERAVSLLTDYQRRRLLVYLYPGREPHGMAWNKRQSEIAVGSGGLWGKGYLKGDQNLLGYLPREVSYSDFVFSVLAEEKGFAGSMAVLLLFACILFPALAVGVRCRDPGGRLLCAGIAALVFCHVFVNIAMTVGLVPVVGLPLPFISNGGSFLLSVSVALGLVQSVAVHGHRAERTFERD
jgi:rod shape determining protein RodA